MLVDINVLTSRVLLNTLSYFKNAHECILLNQIKFTTVLYWAVSVKQKVIFKIM